MEKVGLTLGFSTPEAWRSLCPEGVGYPFYWRDHRAQDAPITTPQKQKDIIMPLSGAKITVIREPR